jgi:hypothetical protein
MTVLVGCEEERAAPPPIAVRPIVETPPAAPDPVEPEGAAVEEPALPLEPPALALAGATVCRAGPPHELARFERRRTRVAIAYGARGGLAAWASEENTLSARPIDAEGRPAGETVSSELRKAEGLEELVAIPQGFVALSAAPLCERYGSSCYQAIALDGTGRALGAPSLPAPGDQWVTFTSVAATRDGVWAAIASRYGYRLVRFRVRPDGAMTEEHAENLQVEEAGTGDVPIRAVAATAEGDALALVLDRYDTVAKLYRSATGSIRRLHGFGATDRELHVDLFEVIDDELVLVFDRRLARIGLDGALTERPAPIRERARLPESIRDRVLPRIEARGPTSMLVRSDLLRIDIGEPTPIASTLRDGTPVAAVAWIDRRFVAIAAEPAGGELVITTRAIDCAPP